MDQSHYEAGDNETREKIRNRCIRKTMNYKDMYGRSKEVFIPGIQPVQDRQANLHNLYGPTHIVEKIPVQLIEDESQYFEPFQDQKKHDFSYSRPYPTTTNYSDEDDFTRASPVPSSTPSCVDICAHVSVCPVCSIVHRSTNGILIAVIVIMSLIILVLLKKVLFTSANVS